MNKLFKFEYLIEYFDGTTKTVYAFWPYDAGRKSGKKPWRWIHCPKVKSIFSKIMNKIVESGDIEARDWPTENPSN